MVTAIFVWALAAQVAAAEPARAMAALDGFLGEWIVEVTEASGAAYVGRSSISIVQPGSAHQEILELPSSPLRPNGRVRIIGLRSYDAFRGVYRFVYHDSLTGLLDVYVGRYQGDALVVTNLESGTTIPLPGGGEAHTRITYTPHADGYAVTLESSVDRGAVWQPVMTSKYRKARPLRPPQ